VERVPQNLKTSLLQKEYIFSYRKLQWIFPRSLNGLQGGKWGFFYFTVSIICFSDFIIICVYMNTNVKSWELKKCKLFKYFCSFRFLSRLWYLRLLSVTNNILTFLHMHEKQQILFLC